MILSKLNAELLTELLTKFQHGKRTGKDNSEIKEIIVHALKAESASRVVKNGRIRLNLLKIAGKKKLIKF